MKTTYIRRHADIFVPSRCFVIHWSSLSVTCCYLQQTQRLADSSESYVVSPPLFLLTRRPDAFMANNLSPSASCRNILVTLRGLEDHHRTGNDARFLFIINVDFWAYASSPQSGAPFSLKALCVRRLCSYSSSDAARTPTS